MAGFCGCTVFFLTSLAFVATAFMTPGHSPSTRLVWTDDWLRTLTPWLLQLGLLLGSAAPVLLVVGLRFSVGIGVIFQVLLSGGAAGLLGCGVGAFISRRGGSLPLDWFVRAAWLFAPPVLGGVFLWVLPGCRLPAVDALNPLAAVYLGGWAFVPWSLLVGGTLLYAAVRRPDPLVLVTVSLVVLGPFFLVGLTQRPVHQRLYAPYFPATHAPESCPLQEPHAHLVDTSGTELLLRGHTERACTRMNMVKQGVLLPVDQLAVLERRSYSDPPTLRDLSRREREEYGQVAPAVTPPPLALSLALLALALYGTVRACRSAPGELPWGAWVSLLGVVALFLMGLGWVRTLALGVFLAGVNLIAWRTRRAKEPAPNAADPPD